MSRNPPVLSVVKDHAVSQPGPGTVAFATFYGIKQELGRTRKQLRELREKQAQSENLNVALLNIARALVRRTVAGSADPDNYISDVLALGALGQTLADQFRDFVATHSVNSVEK
jgi:hypothetical protein